MCIISVKKIKALLLVLHVDVPVFCYSVSGFVLLTVGHLGHHGPAVTILVEVLGTNGRPDLEPVSACAPPGEAPVMDPTERRHLVTGIVTIVEPLKLDDVLVDLVMQAPAVNIVSHNQIM